MISITIPTHNRQNLISRAIKSIQNQTFRNWELIVVDDGSTDNTKDVVQNFIDKDARIKYILKGNSGAAHSRNVGVAHSNGQYITFLDSDDEAKEDWLEKIIAVINESRVSMVCCGCEIVDHEGNLLTINLPESKLDFFGKQDYKMTNGGVFALERQLFIYLGGYDDKLQSGQHTELSLRLIPYILDAGLKIENIYESLIKIHIHEGDRIRGNKKAKYLGSKRTLEKHTLFFSDRPYARSDYEGVVAYNASLLGMRKEAYIFAKKSFISNPSFKHFLRIVKYAL